MIVIVGESASGKTTLTKLLCEKHPEIRRIVAYTTRPMRKGQKNGVDYHFITSDEFEQMVNADEFIEHNRYRNWNYGTVKSDCKDSDNIVAILTPAGFRALKRAGIKTTSVYLYVDRRSRLIQIVARGDNIDEAYRRNLSDVGQFDAIEDEVDYVIDNTAYRMNKEETLRCLEEILGQR